MGLQLIEDLVRHREIAGSPPDLHAGAVAPMEVRAPGRDEPMTPRDSGELTSELARVPAVVALATNEAHLGRGGELGVEVVALASK